MDCRSILYLGTLLVFTTVLCETEMARGVSQKNELGLSWSTCGSPSDPIKVMELVLSPTPVHLPGYISILFDIKVGTNISSPVQVDLKLKKKTFLGWFEIPCEDDVGSCTYADVCAMSPYKDNCPPSFTKHNLPCHCPIQQGRYSMKTSKKYVNPKIPSWLERGKYKGSVNAHSNGIELACLDFQFSVD